MGNDKPAKSLTPRLEMYKENKQRWGGWESRVEISGCSVVSKYYPVGPFGRNRRVLQINSMTQGADFQWGLRRRSIGN